MSITKAFHVSLTAMILGILLLPRVWVQASAPISGNSLDFGIGINLGASTDSVYSAVAGDLDNDGDLDIVSASFAGEDFEVIAWQNDGTSISSLWAQTDVGATTDWVRSVALGDLDNDGDLDIVSASSIYEDFEVIAWQNDGTPFSGLWPQSDIGASVDDVNQVALGDLDRDGDLDVVSVSASPEDYEVIAWQNDGTPFSGLWPQSDVGASIANVYSVAIGDLDRDGDPDIVTGSGDPEDFEIIAWENDGSPFTGLWTAANIGPSAAIVESVALGDLDRDGDIDIVSASWAAEDFEIIAWQNDGTPFNSLWLQADVGASSDGVYTIALGDLDGDGDLDIASGSGANEDFEIIAWQNEGAPFVGGTWGRTDVGASLDWVRSVTLGDLDEDGDLDIVSGSGSGEDFEIIAWENTHVHRNAPFSMSGIDAGASEVTVFSVSLTDLDADSDLDVVTGAGSAITVWQNDGSPFIDLWPATDVGTGTDHIFSTASGDLDNDGDLDIVSGLYILGEGHKVVAWENDGTPNSGETWAHVDVGPTSDHVRSVAVGDLDGDGDLDIVSSTQAAEDYEIIAWQNDGTPFNDAWGQTDVGASTAEVRSVALGDLDQDGDLDIVSGSTSPEDYKVIAWQNNGTPFAGLWAQTDVGASADALSVAIGDLDRDGDLDIVSGGAFSGDFKIIAWQNDGAPFDGLWPQNDVGESSDDVLSVAIGDLDADGDLDIVSSSASGEDFELISWRNDGTPFIGTWAQHDVGASTEWVLTTALGDLDGDGDLDIVSGSEFGEDFDIIAWENLGGSAGLTVTSTVESHPILNGNEDDALKIEFTHNGIVGDASLELNTFYFRLMQADCTTQLTSVEANAIIDSLRVRLDDSDNIFEATDALVAEVATLNLTGGAQSVVFTDDDSNVQVATGTSKTYWVSLDTTTNATGQQPNSLCILFDPDADAIVEGKGSDYSVSIQDTSQTSTGPIAIAYTYYLPLVLK